MFQRLLLSQVMWIFSPIKLVNAKPGEFTDILMNTSKQCDCHKKKIFYSHRGLDPARLQVLLTDTFKITTCVHAWMNEGLWPE